MNISLIYQKWEEETLQRGQEEGRLKDRRILVTHFLKPQFSDEELPPIVERLSQLPPEELASILRQASQASREELMAKFSHTD